MVKLLGEVFVLAADGLEMVATVLWNVGEELARR